jgi:hypothetical protein
MLLLTGCTSQKVMTEQKIAEYQIITKDVCRENQHEVRLAQALYTEMIRN